MTDTSSFHEAPRPHPDFEGPLSIEILIVGDELLAGEPDRNGRRLAAIYARGGATVRRRCLLPDEVSAISEEIRAALERSAHLVILTGGLGGATNDRTWAGVSSALSKPLQANEIVQGWVEARLRRLHRRKKISSSGMTAAREKLSLLPLGFEPIPNESGFSSGGFLRLPGGSALLCLPGDPHQAQQVFEAAEPLLKEFRPHGHLATREVEAPTTDECELVETLEQLRREHPKVRVMSRPPDTRQRPRVTIVLEVSGLREEAESTVESAFRRLLALAAGVH
jgi:molybdopterin-biosynthesis enzyme MoeA-like protein